MHVGRPADLDDAALVDAIDCGQEDALAEAYRRYGSKVFAMAKLLCDAPTAEDVVQDVFTKLWCNPEKFDASRGSLGAFLVAQARFRAIDLLRSTEARRRRERGGEANRPVVEAVTEQEVLARHLADSVRRLLLGLPTGEREAIALAYLEGHTYREVAVLLSQPEGTVKSRIRNGLSRLRLLVSEHGLEDALHAV